MVRIDVNPDKVLGPVSRNLYGQMVEHAYWSVHRGLCSQLLDNGGFELDRDGAFKRVAQHWQIWSSCADNRYHALLDSEYPFNGAHSQKIVVERLARGEVVLQQCFVSVKKNVADWGFIFLKGDAGEVRVQLRDIDGKPLAEQAFEIRHDEWREYKLELTPSETCRDAKFCVVMRSEGVLWVDQAQLYPSDDYMGHRTRADIVENYKALKPAFLRWPGGTYLVWHHWKNGIGPLENRLCADGRILKDTFGVGHFGEWDPNTFGTDEFMQLCRDCDAEPMFNVNLKDTLQNALDWVEYANGGTDTPWGAKRAENGHPEPYNVKYWVIDNEPMIIGNMKGFSPELYPLLAAKFAREMKKKDPSIETFIMGNHNTQELMDRHPDFSELVASHNGDVLDKLCVHCYYDQSYYAPMQGMTQKLGETFDRLKETLDKYCEGRDTKVFLSEYNPEGNTSVAGNMGQAIETANMFHMLEHKSAQGVADMATMCQLCVNVDLYRGRWLRSAMVQIDRERSWLSPMYHVTRIYSELYQPLMVELDDKGIERIPSVAFSDADIPAVDMVATRSEDGKRLVIKAVNNTLRKAYPLEINVPGANIARVTAHRVASDSIFDMNTQFTPETVKPERFPVAAEKSSFRYDMTPNQVVAFDIELQ